MPSAPLADVLGALPVTIVADNNEQTVLLTGGGAIQNAGSEDCDIAVSTTDDLPSCGPAGEQRVGQITLPAGSDPLVIQPLWKSIAYKSGNGTVLSYLPRRG